MPSVRFVCLALGLIALSACGSSGVDLDADMPEVGDAGMRAGDAAMTDAGATDAGPLDAGPLDAGWDDDAGARDAEDAGTDDAGTDDAGADDAGADDAGADDAGADDAGADDAGTDAGTADAGTDAGVSLPATCTDDLACGPDAECDETLARCTCRTGFLPCGGTCCPYVIEHELTLASAGAEPEIASASDATWVLYREGAFRRVHMTRIDPTSGLATDERLFDGVSSNDGYDLAVTPDGAQHIVTQRAVGSGRTGSFTHHRRAGIAGGFTDAPVLSEGAESLASTAIAAIARGPGNTLAAITNRRVGDGHSGLWFTLGNGDGSWLTSQRLLSSGFRNAELQTNPTGGYVLLVETSDNDFLYALDADGSTRGSAITAGIELAFAVADDGVVYYTREGIGGGDLFSNEIPPRVEELDSTGAWADFDMALDADGNPAVVVHNQTQREVHLFVGMPQGGFARITWDERRFGGRDGHLTLDLETLPSGALALAAGERAFEEPLYYLEIRR